ncbi:hypothetical protein T484DRAFT_1764059 [Baffinella frigidus]|nr:hypothetical protein T484DRAFT_1764059 [Cryptophyta sp. CCMP2293]
MAPKTTLEYPSKGPAWSASPCRRHADSRYRRFTQAEVGVLQRELEEVLGRAEEAQRELEEVLGRAEEAQEANVGLAATIEEDRRVAGARAAAAAERCLVLERDVAHLSAKSRAESAARILVLERDVDLLSAKSTAESAALGEARTLAAHLLALAGDAVSDAASVQAASSAAAAHADAALATERRRLRAAQRALAELRERCGAAEEGRAATRRVLSALATECAALQARAMSPYHSRMLEGAGEVSCAVREARAGSEESAVAGALREELEGRLARSRVLAPSLAGLVREAVSDARGALSAAASSQRAEQQAVSDARGAASAAASSQRAEQQANVWELSGGVNATTVSGIGVVNGGA